MRYRRQRRIHNNVVAPYNGEFHFHYTNDPTHINFSKRKWMEFGNSNNTLLQQWLSENKVTSLTFGNNKAVPEHLSSLVDTIVSSNTLVYLNFSYANITDSKPLVQLCRYNTSIKMLNLSYNSGLYDLTSLFQALKQNIAIEHLILRSINLTKTTMVISLLNANKTISLLDLSKNPISEKQLKKLFDALQDNHSLTSLNVSNIPCGSRAMKSIAEMVQKNSMLHTLQANQIEGTQEDFTALGTSLLLNNSLVHLSLAFNFTQSTTFWSELKSSMKNNTCLLRFSIFSTIYWHSPQDLYHPIPYNDWLFKERSNDLVYNLTPLLPNGTKNILALLWNVKDIYTLWSQLRYCYANTKFSDPTKTDLYKQRMNSLSTLWKMRMPITFIPEGEHCSLALLSAELVTYILSFIDIDSPLVACIAKEQAKRAREAAVSSNYTSM